MSDDWLIEIIDEVDEAGRVVWGAMIEVLELLAEARRERVNGTPIAEVTEWLFGKSGPKKRRAVAAAFARWENAIMRGRAELVRALVEDEGMTITAVAQKMEISRQMAARLYQAARTGTPTPS
jgi:hypothetical protein